MKYKRREISNFQTQACFDQFICNNCGYLVVPEGAGSSHRNHCSQCLSSKHVDHLPGDRASKCSGIMEAIGVWVRKNGEWAIIHRCSRCGHISANRIAADDNPIKLMSLALQPLARPPFPLNDLGHLEGGVQHE